MAPTSARSLASIETPSMIRLTAAGWPLRSLICQSTAIASWPGRTHPGLDQHPGPAAVAGAGHLDAGVAVLAELRAVLAREVALEGARRTPAAAPALAPRHGGPSTLAATAGMSA